MEIANILQSTLSNIIPFTILISILVFVHELGHFAVARWCGVKVEVFSIGFGKKILSYVKGDTTYCISLIPFGGYVKMFGEQGGEDVPEDQKNVSFTHKKVWQRMAIVVAGPLMNLFFAVLVFAGIAYKGEEARTPRIAEVQEESYAEKSGLKSQDLIVSADGQQVKTYDDFQKILNSKIGSTVQLDLLRDDQTQQNISFEVTSMTNPNPFSLQKNIGQIEGIVPYAKGTLVAIKPDSLAFRFGIRTGDEIVKIQDRKATGWKSLNSLLSSQGPFEVVVERTIHDKKEKLKIEISNIDKTSITSLEQFGIESPDLYLEQVVKGSPADKAGLQKYDKLIQIDDLEIQSWEQILNKIKSYSGDEALTVKVLRDGTEIIKKITPQMTSQMTLQGKEDKRYTVGIISMVNLAQPETIHVSADNIFSAINKGWERSVDISVMTVMSFVKLFQGEVSHKNIGGMISIGKAAKDSYQMGAQAFFMTMGILSISLFILNLLPVPVLDGGHLVFYTIELIKGSPLSGKKLEIAHRVGFALLMGLMVLALFNDFTKFLFS